MWSEHIHECRYCETEIVVNYEIDEDGVCIEEKEYKCSYCDEVIKAENIVPEIEKHIEDAKEQAEIDTHGDDVLEKQSLFYG